MSNYAGLTFEEAQEREKKEYAFSYRSDWIDIKKKKPQVGQTIIVTNNSILIDIGQYLECGNVGTETGLVMDATHWQHLPLTPAQEERLFKMECMNYKPEY